MALRHVRNREGSFTRLPRHLVLGELFIRGAKFVSKQFSKYGNLYCMLPLMRVEQNFCDASVFMHRSITDVRRVTLLQANEVCFVVDWLVKD